MARWKARVEFLISVIELLFLSLTVGRYKAECVKTRCLQEGMGQFQFKPRFQGEGGRPLPKSVTASWGLCPQTLYTGPPSN